MVLQLFDPIRGEPNPAKDIMDFEYKYAYEKGNMYHPYKMDYWREYIISIAEAGYLEAQACIVNSVRKGGGFMFPLQDEIYQTYKEKYEKSLMQAV